MYSLPKYLQFTFDQAHPAVGPAKLVYGSGSIGLLSYMNSSPSAFQEVTGPWVSGSMNYRFEAFLFYRFLKHTNLNRT